MCAFWPPVASTSLTRGWEGSISGVPGPAVPWKPHPLRRVGSRLTGPIMGRVSSPLHKEIKSRRSFSTVPHLFHHAPPLPPCPTPALTLAPPTMPHSCRLAFTLLPYPPPPQCLAPPTVPRSSHSASLLPLCLVLPIVSRSSHSASPLPLCLAPPTVPRSFPPPPHTKPPWFWLGAVSRLDLYKWLPDSSPHSHVSSTYSQGEDVPAPSETHVSHDLTQASSQPHERGSVVPFLCKETRIRW